MSRISLRVFKLDLQISTRDYCEQTVFRLLQWCAVAMMLFLKTYQKWLFYHLPRSFKIFMNVFAFLYVKANSKLRKSVKKEYFLLFSRKKLSAFLFKFKANRPFPSALVPLFQNESKCETFHMKMSSACSFIFMQIKVIFIRMVSQLDSLWNRGTRELGNGLLCRKMRGYPNFSL